MMSLKSEIIPKRFRFARGAAWLFLVASILLLVYTYYRAEITFHGSMDNGYFKYYLISLAGIIFWGGVLRLKDEIKLNIVMVTTSLVVGLYLVEISLNLVFPIVVGNRAAAARAAGVEFDTRTKFQVSQNLKSEGVDAVPSVHPCAFIGSNGVAGVEPLYPFGGVSGKTTVFCNESGKYLNFPSDRYGFNNPDSEWDSSQTEWVLTGDSFAHGTCVNSGDDIAGLLRSITGETVINLGNAGNGPLIELAVLKEYAESRKPKTVLWVYYEDNELVKELIGEKSSPLLMSYLQPEFSQNLIHRQTEIDNRLGKYIAKAEAEAEAEAEALLWKIRVLRLYNIRERIGFDVDVEVEADVDVSPLFTEILTKARDRTAAWGGKLYFVYLP
ncbi:MAG: hypothetical protein ABFS56_12365, partial [Pseudomonadota bacterium]